MKKDLFVGFLLVIWIITTVILVCSIIGLTLLVPQIYADSENIPSTWMKIGHQLSDYIVKPRN